MGKVRDKSIVMQILKENCSCELCGSKKQIEVHHIIPLSVIPKEINGDTLDNCIAICSSCHGKLTNKSLLTKIALSKKKAKNEFLFYEKLNACCEDGERLSVDDVLDIFDSIYMVGNEKS